MVSPRSRSQSFSAKSAHDEVARAILAQDRLGKAWRAEMGLNSEAQV